MYNILKPLLFSFNPEQAHKIAMNSAKMCLTLPFGRQALRIMAGKADDDPVELFGIKFKNRVGLAAGFDKNGHYIQVLEQFGFGHIEVGTVTPRPQPGNPQPRLFRLQADKALINRMGFNNLGVHQLAERLRQLPPDRPVIGGNIGKNKDTANEDAWKDYLYCFRQLHSLVDYFTVNLSSPNTPGLRALQEKEPLIRILSGIQEYNKGLADPRPVLLKISPDNEVAVLDDIIEVARQCELSGLIATNTTVDRAGLSISPAELEMIGAGGLSGQPLKQRSLNVVRYLRSHIPAEIKIIGVGGISGHDDYENMADAGAALVQLYTAFIYQGPGIVKNIIS